MKNGKLTYREVLNKCEALEKKVKALEEANKIADRHPVNYECERWIAVPLHPRQSEVAREYFEDRIRFDNYDLVGDERRYEEFHESGLLPEYRIYLLRYSTDLQGNRIDTLSVWGLIPIRMY